jgi:hypothetical protein
MATQRSATVSVTNDSGGNARILLFHNNSSNGTQRGSWAAEPGQTVGPLTVYFETGFGTWGHPRLLVGAAPRRGRPGPRLLRQRRRHRLVLVTYDEHGGLYDCVAPTAATPPGDDPDYGYNVNGFDFDLYGVRVPGVVVSPLIPAGTVDHTLYDHSSVLKTLEELFRLSPLTQRDAAANGLLNLLSLDTPRTDCPTSLDSPAPPKSAKPRVTAAERVLRDARPVPESGNLVGALHNLLKAEIELSGRTPPELAAITERFDAIRTRGQARAYAASVLEKVAVTRRQRKLASQR